ncbi:unnamed protein product, partial [Heterosigma akashiwo]
MSHPHSAILKKRTGSAGQMSNPYPKSVFQGDAADPRSAALPVKPNNRQPPKLAGGPVKGAFGASRPPPEVGLGGEPS